MAGLSNSSTFRSGLTPKVNDREDYFNSQVIKESNTYSTWDEMSLFNDITDINLVEEKGSNGKTVVKEKSAKHAGKGVKSLFNKWTLVPVLNIDTRTKLNAPLVDSSSTRAKIKEMSNPSIKNLVAKSQDGTLGRETYSYSDFMYCKHLGKMPNNYLITLRRFPVAVGDYIGQLVNDKEEREIATSLGCMVTWLGTPGNEIENILSYTFKMPFKDVEAELQTINRSDNSSKLGNIFAAFDSKYQQQVAAGQASAAFKPFADKLRVPFGDAPYTDQLTYTDSHKVYGPVDVVKKTSMRDDKGLEFDHNINLRFEYELRSYSNINTRQAMLDLLANILTVTYVNGSFWGGGYRGFGPHQSDIFSNLKIMKTKGGFTDFMDAFANDVSTVGSSIKDSVKKQGGIVQTLKNLANNFGGMLMGGLLNSMGRPQKQTVNSLLSPAPVGLWHVTIGNPFHPIMSIGNMIISETKITHQGPLGLDDFPTKLIVDVSLKRAKPRDANEIERLYNSGAVRIYTGMGPHTADIIKAAPSYKSIEKAGKEADNAKLAAIAEITDMRERQRLYNKYMNSKEDTLLGNVSTDAMTRYWQTHDMDAIKLAGMEWLRGGGSKTKQAQTGETEAEHPVNTR